MEAVTLADIEAARQVAGAVAKHTPVVSSSALTERFGRPIVLKAENLQRAGAFKIRGAMNKLDALGDRAQPGVTAGSAGNHALAVAFAARHYGVPCDIFVPTGAPITKIESCQAYGATVVEGAATLDDAMAAAQEFAGRARPGVLPPVRRPRRRRRTGHARTRAGRGSRRPRLRRRAARRGRAVERRRHRRQVAHAPT